MSTRFLRIKEFSLLKTFIKNNYQKNHIMTKSNRITEFFFFNRKKNRINFIGTFEKKKLSSILGVVQNKKWDENLENDIQLSLWLSKKKSGNGLSTLLFILNKFKPKSLWTSGINPNTSGLVYKIFGQIFKYDHFYISNPKIKMKVSKNLKVKRSFSIQKNNFKNLKITKNIVSLPKHKFYPRKSILYFKNKYENNPFYNYFYLNFFFKNKLLFFFVCREIKISKLNRKIVSVVDFYGDLDKNISYQNEIIKYLTQNNLEYMDFLLFGVNTKIMRKIGFQKKNTNQIIPNYFEPFIKKNAPNFLVIIKNPYKKKLISVKADSDQERPSKLKG